MNLRNRLLDAALLASAAPHTMVESWRNLNVGESLCHRQFSTVRWGLLRFGSPGLMVLGFLDEVKAPGGPLVEGGEPTSIRYCVGEGFSPSTREGAVNLWPS